MDKSFDFTVSCGKYGVRSQLINWVPWFLRATFVYLHRQYQSGWECYSRAGYASDSNISSRYVEASILSLPTEVLSKIIWGLLREGCWRNVANIAETCRRLNGIATPILYAELCLYAHNVKMFDNRHARYSGLQCSIQTLTISMFDKDLGCAASRQRWRTFAKSLPNMPNLRILAVKTGHTGMHHDHYENGALSTLQERISRLLLAIPPNVLSLNIDIENIWSRDTYNESTCDKLCTLIRRLIPQLRHLRICQLQCCSELFSGMEIQAPYLESFILQPHNHFGFMLSSKLVGYETSSPEITRMAEEARRVYLARLFPRIKKFLVTCPHLPNVKNNVNLNRCFPAAQRINIIENTTAVIPFASTTYGYNWARFPEHSHIEGNLYSRQRKTQHFFECLEENAWTTTHSGVLVPSPLLKSDKHCYEVFPWTHIHGPAPTIDTTWNYWPLLDIPEPDWRFPLEYKRSLILDFEKIVGTKLIVPRVTSGLVDAEPLLCRSLETMDDSA